MKTERASGKQHTGFQTDFHNHEDHSGRDVCGSSWSGIGSRFCSSGHAPSLYGVVRLHVDHSFHLKSLGCRIGLRPSQSRLSVVRCGIISLITIDGYLFLHISLQVRFAGRSPLGGVETARLPTGNEQEA